MNVTCKPFLIFSLDNWAADRPERRWYFEVSFERGDKWFEYIKLPVAGGHCTGLLIGTVHIGWGGWRALNWD